MYLSRLERNEIEFCRRSLGHNGWWFIFTIAWNESAFMLTCQPNHRLRHIFSLASSFVPYQRHLYLHLAHHELVLSRRHLVYLGCVLEFRGIHFFYAISKDTQVCMQVVFICWVNEFIWVKFLFHNCYSFKK